MCEAGDDLDGDGRWRDRRVPEPGERCDAWFDVRRVSGQDRPRGDVGESAAGRVDHGANVVERAERLLLGVVTDDLAVFIDAVLPPDEQQRGTGRGLDGLAEGRVLVESGWVVMPHRQHCTSYTGAMLGNASDPTGLPAGVMSRRELDPATRRRFRTGRVSLDFTHTGGEGEYARWEILHRPADVSMWLAVILEVPSVRTRLGDMTMVRELRAAITTAARTITTSANVDPDLAEVINAAAGRPSLVPRLDADGQVVLSSGTAAQACSTIARDAIDLLGSPARDRIRICEAFDCGLLFVDASRPGRRRWCSMDWCGDREKKRRAGRPVR